ncbi:MAG TPA: ferritin family protein [Myxococcales bacterium]|jgi:rubrerythrin
MDGLDALLAKAERVEALSATLYRRLAEGLASGSGARVTFARLAAEEEEHAARIRLLKTRIEARPWNPELTLDLAGAEAMVADAEALLGLVEAEGPPASVEGAARLMIESERRLSAVHAHELVAGDPELESFFAELAMQDQVHLEILRRLDERR